MNNFLPTNFLKLQVLFSGSFSLVRQVSSPQLKISGMAHFNALSHNESFFEESGAYVLGKATQPYYQRRYFIISEKSLYILKEDRSVLHGFYTGTCLKLGVLQLKHTHVCGNDLYKATFLIHSSHCFIWDYDIITPTTRYQISSIYERAEV